MHSPVVWIDEQTKEYVVVWELDRWCVVYSKKGDAFWNQIQMPPLPDFTERFFDMVYKDDKLYLLLHTGRRGRSTGFIKIFDFSTQIPQETFHCGVTSNNNNTSDSDSDSWGVWATKLVVTVTGHVLKVEKLAKLVNPGGQGGPLRLWSFRVYKHHDEPVASLGHEAMLFDLGFTVLADDHLVGFKSNSIYFNVICQKQNTTQICVFDLDTQEMEEPLPKFVCSSWQQRLRARWFLPSFKHT
uniref:Putative F-box protein n=1 Tax=Noccaea caerulescens TaxID=107243 RepID=A0A1J3G8E3_NOCCA